MNMGAWSASLEHCLTMRQTGYISTVVVAPDRQGRGIGRELVKRLMECEKPAQITWVLRTQPGSQGFWQKMGFRKSESAMEIVRTE